MNIFYPVIPRRRLPAMLGIAALGAVLAGCYGALHDQISYTISPEYFTKVKFEQFRYADFGWPPRIMVSEVGFLASWWVGMIGGWILARVGLDQLPADKRKKDIAIAFSIVFITALLFGIVGTSLGYLGKPIKRSIGLDALATRVASNRFAVVHHRGLFALGQLFRGALWRYSRHDFRSPTIAEVSDRHTVA